MISFLNKGSGGGSSKANVFIQEAEPETKEGIWFKKTAGTYNKLITADTISSEPYFEIGPTQLYQHKEVPSIAVGTDIYMFSGVTTDSNKAEKYNTITDTCSNLAEYNPTSDELANGGSLFWDESLNAIGIINNKDYTHYMLDTNIYDNSGSVNSQFTWYSHMLLPNFNNNIYNAAASALLILNNINKNVTKVAIPVTGYYSGWHTILKGNSIYLFPCDSYNMLKTYRYDIDTNSFTELASMPYGTLKSVAELNNNIHIFGIKDSGNYPQYNKHYIYNINTDTWTEAPDLSTPVTLYSRAVTINDTIYITSADANAKTILKYREPSISFEPNSVVLQNGSTYKTALLTQPANVQGRVTTSFDKAYMTDSSGNLITTDERYYGNGTEWIAIN